jgi:hypothetical protein
VNALSDASGRRARLPALVVAVAVALVVGVTAAAAAAMTPLPAGAATPSATVAATSSPSPLVRLPGSHLPFITVAGADVECLRATRVTLPYRLEDADGPSQVTVTVRTTAGRPVKTLVVPGTVPGGTDEHVAFLCNLAPGVYRWSVAATDASGRTAARRIAARLTVDAVFPSPAAIARASDWLKSRAGVTALAVVDTSSVLHGWHRNEQFVTASVIKAMLLVEYLRTHATLSSWAVSTLTPMIEESDNTAAEAVYHVVGDAGLYSLAKAAGMTRFSIAGVLFGAQLTAADQARYFYRLPSLVPKAHRAFALYLLSHIVSYQSWGIPAAARPLGWQVWFKGGWRGTDIGQLVHQLARLSKGPRTFSMAVFTNGDPSQAYGIQTIAGVAARLVAGT